MRIDVELSQVTAPLAALEAARAAAAALCAETVPQADASLAELREIEQSTRERTSEWPAPVAAARELESDLRAELGGAEKQRARLGRAVRWAQRVRWLRGLWRRLSLRRKRGDGRD
jgi:hypothetical protein